MNLELNEAQRAIRDTFRAFADREVLGRTVATLLRGAPTFWCLDEAPPPVSQ